MTTLFQWLESSSWAVAIRQSLWLYPVLEIFHILGIVLLVGSALIFDLRLLGFSKSIPVKLLADHALPWSRRGLIFVIPSGLLLFITNAETLSMDVTFWLKMIFIAIAALNVYVFHKVIFRPYADPRIPDKLPPAAKVSAIVSILAWIAVIACGRLLAY